MIPHPHEMRRHQGLVGAAERVVDAHKAAHEAIVRLVYTSEEPDLRSPQVAPERRPPPKGSSAGSIAKRAELARERSHVRPLGGRWHQQPFADPSAFPERS
jgi:hypothetical protein